MGNDVAKVVSQLQQYIRVNTNYPNPFYGSSPLNENYATELSYDR